MARVEQSIEVNVPVGDAYNQMTQFEEFPRFMEGVHSVRQLDDAHLHWCAQKGGHELEWDAEITRQIPDRCIAWRNTSGPKSEGEVRFDAIEPDKTRITLIMEAEDQLLKHPESIGDTAPKPDQDLARFKKMIESQQQASGARRGEIHSGQPVDNTAVAAPAVAPIFDAAVRPARRLVELAETQGNTLRQAWPAPVWGADFYRYWQDQAAMFWQLGRQAEQFFSGWARLSSLQPALPHAGPEWSPAVELAERDGAVVVCADLPGVKRDDLRVEVTGGQLIIEGARRGEAASTSLQDERPHGRFYRAVRLPAEVDVEASEATMRDGVLEITLPMASGGRIARRLEVRQAGR